MSIEPIELVSIEICTDPWDLIEVDAFVCPGNGDGTLSHYPASRIHDLAGPGIAEQLEGHTPLAIGAAFVTSAGRMRAQHLIYVPNTEHPGGEVKVEDVLRATSAALVAADQKGYTTVAIPLMGAFENGILAEEAARAIHSQIRAFRGHKPRRVMLMAKDGDEVEVFDMAIETGG